MFSDVSGSNHIPILSGCWQPVSAKPDDSTKITEGVISVGDTKPSEHPEDGDAVTSRNVRETSYPEAAVCPRKFH